MHSDMVKDFHIKYGFPVNRSLACENTGENLEMTLMVTQQLLKLGKYLVELADTMKERGQLCQQQGDGRLYRAHMMVEELGELLVALNSKDEKKVAHELCDLLYTVVGTAVQYNLPVEECFDELHESNMTKEQTPDGRMRSRHQSASYIPPNMAVAIQQGRKPKPEIKCPECGDTELQAPTRVIVKCGKCNSAWPCSPL